MAKPSEASISPLIEQDRKGRWHPALEIRERGRVVYAITATHAHVWQHRAMTEATEAAHEVQRMARA